MPKADLPVHANQMPRPASPGGLRVREDVLFTDAGGEDNKGARKRATKILEKVTGILTRALAPDETVFYVARAQAPIGVIEQYGMGWYVYAVTATALVFTNRRILHLGVDSRGNWKSILKTVNYGDLAKAEVKGWLTGVLWLTYKDGKKEKYWNVTGGVKKLKVLMSALLPAAAGESTGAQGFVSLCPECLAPLTERVYHCARCGMVFKDEATMKKRVLLVPGGGYFYCKQSLLGVLDLIGEGWIMVLLLIFAAAAVVGWGKPAAKPDDLSAVGFLMLGVFMLLILGLKKLLTLRHCQRFVREFIPTGQKDPMRAQMAASSSLK